MLQDPVLAARIVKTMIQTAPGNWYLRGGSTVRQILMVAISSGSEEAKQEAREAINSLGEHGDYSCQDLLGL